MNRLYFLEDDSSFILSEVLGVSEIYKYKGIYKYDIYCRSKSLNNFQFNDTEKENVKRSREKLIKAVDNYLRDEKIDQSI